MSFTIGLLLVIGGAVIGFFIARQFPVMLEDNKLKEELQQIKVDAQDYQTDVDNYVNDVQYNINKLESQLADVKLKLANPPHRQSQALDQLTGTAPFFSNEAFAHLRSAERQRTRDTEIASAPPLDYSGEASGLFTGGDDKPKAENEKKELAE